MDKGTIEEEKLTTTFFANRLIEGSNLLSQGFLFIILLLGFSEILHDLVPHVSFLIRCLPIIPG